MPTRRKFRKNKRKSRKRGKKGGNPPSGGLIKVLKEEDGMKAKISFPQGEEEEEKVINAVKTYYKSKLQNMQGAKTTAITIGSSKRQEAKKVQEEQMRIIYNLAYEKLQIEAKFSNDKDKFLGKGVEGKFSPLKYNITWPGIMGKNHGKLAAIVGIWGAPFDGTEGYCQGLRKGDDYKTNIFGKGGEKWFWDAFDEKIKERVKRFKINISAEDFVKNSESARPDHQSLLQNIHKKVSTGDVSTGEQTTGGRKRRGRKSRRRKRRTRRRR